MLANVTILADLRTPGFKRRSLRHACGLARRNIDRSHRRSRGRSIGIELFEPPVADDVRGDDNIELGVAFGGLLGSERLSDQRNITEQRDLGPIGEIVLLGQSADHDPSGVGDSRHRMPSRESSVPVPSSW